MFRVKVDISGAKKLIQSGKTLFNSIKKLLGLGSASPTDVILRRLKEYPPELPNQRYIRTDKLKNSWHIERVSDKAIGVVSDSGIAPYNREVQDEDQQLEIHRGRWPTVQSVANVSGDEVLEFFSTRILEDLEV